MANIVERVKNILVSPKSEFTKMAAQEVEPVTTTFFSYAFLLFLIPAAAILIGFGIIGYTYNVFGHSVTIRSFDYGIRAAIISVLASSAAFFVATYIIDALAPNFKSQKNANRAAQLVACTLTPGALAGVFNLFPSLGVLALVAAIYGIYIMYVGLPYMMKTPADQTTVYLIISVVCIIVGYFIVSAIMGSVLYSGFGAGVYGSI